MAKSMAFGETPGPVELISLGFGMEPEMELPLSEPIIVTCCSVGRCVELAICCDWLLPAFCAC